MIQVTSLVKTYGSVEHRISVLDNLSLSLAEGEFLALMGASGTGKSTLLQLLGCLDRPTCGSYMLAGQEVSQASESELAAIRNKQIGFVFQSSFFIEYLDLLENVALPGFYAKQLTVSESRERASQLIESVGLSHRELHRPSMLSGGERQRAAIARALFNRPKLLLADEPTGNLDAKNTALVMDLLEQLNASGISIIVVTHDANVAARAQRVLELSDGLLKELQHATD